MKTKPSIVFAHGLWADGSRFSKLIPTLQAEGHEVIAAQNSLDTLKGDVAAVTRALGRVSSAAILVGHSYGGTVITAAGPTSALPDWSISLRSRRMPTRRRKASRINFRAQTSSATSKSQMVACG